MKRTWAGDTIRIARKAAGLTQEQLAYMLEIPKRTIEDWERGTRKPPSYIALLIRYRLLGY